MDKRVTHGEGRRGQHTPEYDAWREMRKRCYIPGTAQFCDYGGRGIVVCKRWADYANFLEDMGRKPTAAHSLDRKNNSLG